MLHTEDAPMKKLEYTLTNDILFKMVFVDFPMFDIEEFHSEFQPLEVTRGTPLTDKMSLHYFGLPKISNNAC
jgi:hypothetical protein